MSKVVLCPECGRDLTFSDVPVSGQQVRCEHCDADLEIIDAYTMELDWAFKPPVVRDDWEDLDAISGAKRMTYADWANGDERDPSIEWPDDIKDERRMQDPARQAAPWI